MDAPEKSIYIVFLIAALIVGGVFIFYIISLIGYQKQLRKQYRGRLLAELSATEKERTRIAADLHDELGPILSAIKLHLNELEVNDLPDQTLVIKMNKILDETISKVIEISKDLMPDVMARKGLLCAILEFAKRMDKLHDMNIRVNYSSLPFLTTNQTINTYRIIQEVVHNAIKHSRATIMNIDLYSQNNYLFMVLEDDGVGFNFERIIIEQKGLGLGNILSRADLMNGHISVFTSNGSGTRFTIKIPLLKK